MLKKCLNGIMRVFALAFLHEKAEGNIRTNRKSNEEVSICDYKELNKNS
jgi:hypothetical protein